MTDPAARDCAEHTLLVFLSCPADSAEPLAEALVDAGLAACVSRLPGMRSVYRWQGRVERADETLLIAKTRAGRYAELEAAVRRLHPYELPEIVAVNAAGGLPAYLQWVHDSTP
jgi:periplasmic divalent cation tolerance protein